MLQHARQVCSDGFVSMDALLTLTLGGPHLQASPALSPTIALPKGQERGDRYKYTMRKLQDQLPLRNYILYFITTNYGYFGQRAEHALRRPRGLPNSRMPAHLSITALAVLSRRSV